MPRYYAILYAHDGTEREIAAWDMRGLSEQVGDDDAPIAAGTRVWLGLGPRQPSSALLRDLSEMLWSGALS